MKDGYYWFTSERSSQPHIAQRVNQKWYLVGEDPPVGLDEIRRRGYRLSRMVECPQDVLALCGH